MATTSANNNVKINKSMVMKAAWQVVKSKQAKSFSEALAKAWKAYS